MTVARLAQLLRPTIGRQLGAVFLVLTVLGCTAVILVGEAFSGSIEAAHVVDQSGRLRMLSQRLLLTAYRAAEAPPGAADRRQLLALVEQFESGVRTVENNGARGSDSAGAAVVRLRHAWTAYRKTLEAALALRKGDADLPAALTSVESGTTILLDAAEDSVRQIVARHERDRDLLLACVYSSLVAGLLVAAAAYVVIRRRIMLPLTRIADMGRRLAAGELDARVAYDADDEIGDLVGILNFAGDKTQALIRRISSTEHQLDVTERKAAELQLADSERRNRLLWETSTDAVITLGADNRIVSANPAVERIFGYRPDELVGQDLGIIQPEHLRAAHRAGMQNYLASGQRQVDWRSMETTALHRCGHEVPVEIAFSQIDLSSERWFAAFFRDRSAQLAARAELRLRERALESSINGIMIADNASPEQPIIYVNPAFETITGYARADVIGRNGRLLLNADTDQAALEAVRAALRDGHECRAELRNYRKDGSLFWNEMSLAPVRDGKGTITHYVSIINDISERKRQEDQLAHNANHDALTGLPNRNLLKDRLAQAIASAHRHGCVIAVLCLDLDHFKYVNDTLGHGAGDALLRLVADRLRGCVRENDTVARPGGDEFVMVLTDNDNEEEISRIAERVLSALACPAELAGQTVAVATSVGASLFPRDGHDAETLLQHADIAMYRAKENGRNNFQFYTEEMQTRFTRRATLESSLRSALERRQFRLFYQPQVDLESGRIVGAEALIRWIHPELGMVAPAQFIPLAEETGLIVPIGEWVLAEACGQCRTWRDAGLPPVSIAVNLSARQFRQKNLVRVVARALQASGMESMCLELELTESMVMHDPEETIAILRELKEIGLRLSLDDFGTGYSSFNYLRRFPIDVLKIDQSFVRDIEHSADDAAITAAIVSLAHSLKLSVVAEGVESVGQLNLLRALRCDQMQGFLFSRPLPATDFEALLLSGTCLASAIGNE